MRTCFVLVMRDDPRSFGRPLVPIPDAEAGELIALGLTVTKGSALRASIAREAFAVIADRLTEYFRQSGIVLMRPAPRPPHSSNPDAGRVDPVPED